MLTVAQSSSSPSHVAADGSLAQRMRGDTCFKCKRQGHWARDCPLNSPSPSSKTPPRPSSSTLPLSPLEVGSLPIVHCPCGSGPCKVLTSHSSRNPYRRFFACSKRSCESSFNGWCDKVSAPACPCAIGKCSINTDPVSKKKFFACRVKMGHGACEFFHWVDEYNASAKVSNVEAGNAGSPMNVPQRREVSRPTMVYVDSNSTFADFLEVSQSGGSVDLINKFEELAGRFSSAKSNFDGMTMDRQPSIPSYGSEDLEMEDREQPADPDETLPVSRRPSSFADAHHRQMEFLMEMSASGGHTATGAQDSPSVSISVTEDYNVQSFLLMENGKGNPSDKQDFEGFKQTAACIKRELIEKLELSDGHDPAQLQQDATICFAVLDHLGVESQQFKDCVNKFIQHASSLAEIRSGERSLNVLLQRYDEEKRRLEVSRTEGQILNAYAGCSGEIERLRQEALHLKEMLLRVERALNDYDEELVGLDKNLDDIRHKVELAKASMEDASADAAEALRVLKNMEQGAMKAALEKAKEQLHL